MPLPRRLTYHFRVKRRPPLTIAQILEWVDAFKARENRWPNPHDGTRCLPDTSWSAINTALGAGARGLPGGSSLTLLLMEYRGRRHPRYLPPLTVQQILAWADAHHERTGDWPLDKSGRIPEAPGETWMAIEKALWRGRRGMPGDSTLTQFLELHRGNRNHLHLPPLSHALILAWADEHKRRTGRWPVHSSQAVHGVPDQTWTAVNSALAAGSRGLPGGESLARLLAEKRGVRNHMDLDDFNLDEILVWADAYLKRTGRWPTGRAGPIPEAPGETWLAVETALIEGKRGLPGGDSISRLLVRRRGWRNKQAAPTLTVRLIREWVMAYFQRTGTWPNRGTGPILDAPGETWCAADLGLKRGQRGLPGGSSLSRIVRKCREQKERQQAKVLV